VERKRGKIKLAREDIDIKIFEMDLWQMLISKYLKWKFQFSWRENGFMAN